jgi:hypothetical protein
MFRLFKMHKGAEIIHVCWYSKQRQYGHILNFIDTHFICGNTVSKNEGSWFIVDDKHKSQKNIK